MITTTDPSDMTPQDRRAEVAGILALGFLRLKRGAGRPPGPAPAEPEQAEFAADSPPATPAGISRN